MVEKFQSMPFVYRTIIGLLLTTFFASLSWAALRIVKIDALEEHVAELKPACGKLPEIAKDVEGIKRRNDQKDRDWQRVKEDLEQIRQDAAISRFYIQQWATKEGLNPPPTPIPRK